MSVKRDYKKSPQSAKSRAQRPSPRRRLLPLGALLLVAALFMLYGQVKTLFAPQLESTATPPADTATTRRLELPPSSNPAPKYDFYHKLPERQLNVDGEQPVQRPGRPPPPIIDEIATSAAASREAPSLGSRDEGRRDAPASTIAPPPRFSDQAAGANAAAPRRFLIQVGSFQRFEDADRMRARIALLGYSAYVDSDNSRRLNRVRLGPFSHERAKRIHQRLTENSISAFILNDG